MVGVRAAGVRRWLREALADQARRIVLVLVLLLWVGVGVSGTVVGLSQWSHFVEVRRQRTLSTTKVSGHPVEPVRDFRLSPHSDPVPGLWGIECP